MDTFTNSMKRQMIDSFCSSFNYKELQNLNTSYTLKRDVVTYRGGRKKKKPKNLLVYVKRILMRTEIDTETSAELSVIQLYAALCASYDSN